MKQYRILERTYESATLFYPQESDDTNGWVDISAGKISLQIAKNFLDHYTKSSQKETVHEYTNNKRQQLLG